MSADVFARLREISSAMQEAGDRGNLNAMRRGIRAEAQPLIEAARAAARAQLPRKGGLNNYEADQKFRIAVLTGARTTAVRVVGRASLSTDTGRWRHPDPKGGYWSDQTFAEAAGWFSSTLRAKSPEATVLINAELERVADRIRSI